MKQDRLRTIGKLLRFLRDAGPTTGSEDVPARELSKRIARHTLAALEYRPLLDQRCGLAVRELWTLPEHQINTAHPG